MPITSASGYAFLHKTAEAFTLGLKFPYKSPGTSRRKWVNEANLPPLPAVLFD
jgi:hypothetical protein